MVSPALEGIEPRDGEWYAATLPPRPVRNWAVRSLVFVWVAMGVTTIVIAASAAAFDQATTSLFTVVGAIALLIGRLILRQQNRFEALAIREEDAPMLPELGVASGFLVAVWVLQGRVVTGEDRGAMWIEGDRLLFSGRSMSFAPSRDSVDEGLRRRRLGPGELEISLDRVTIGGRLAISFTPLFGDRPYVWEPHSLIATWIDQAQASLEPTQFPPICLGPGADSPEAIRRRIVCKLLGEAAFFGLPLLPLAIEGKLIPALVLVLAAGMGVGYWLPLRKCRLRLREAKRLVEAT